MDAKSVEASTMNSCCCDGRHREQEAAIPESFCAPGAGGDVVPGEGAGNHSGDEDSLGTINIWTSSDP
jgi:hypothetical protein